MKRKAAQYQSFVSILLEWNAHNDTIISTNLHHLHLEIADTIDAIAKSAIRGTVNLMNEKSKQCSAH